MVGELRFSFSFYSQLQYTLAAPHYFPFLPPPSVPLLHPPHTNPAPAASFIHALRRWQAGGRDALAVHALPRPVLSLSFPPLGDCHALAQ